MVGENETTAAAALEREVSDGIDDLLEDVSADPQFSEHPALVTEKERRDDVVPPRVSLVSDLSVLVVVCFLRSRFVRSLLDRLETARSRAGGRVCVCWRGGGSGGCVCCVHPVLKRVPGGYIVQRLLEEVLIAVANAMFCKAFFHSTQRVS